MQCSLPDDIYREFVSRLDAAMSKAVDRAASAPFRSRVKSNIVRALGGEFMEHVQAMLRSMVTVLGMEASRIVEPFFVGCRRVGGKGFQMVCDRLWYEDRPRQIYIRVVLSTDTLNANARRVIEEEARHHPEALVLSLDGFFEEGEHVRQIGRAKWLDGVATWRLLTNCARGYRWWLSQLSRLASRHRKALLDTFMQRWEQLRTKRSVFLRSHHE